MAETTVITDGGISAAIDAGSGGPEVKVSYFKIGSTVITPNRSMTNVTNLVYTGDASQIQYLKLDDSTIVYVITLEEDVGDFNIGNIGIFLEDDTMFSITTLVSPVPKWANDPPDIVGNRKKFNIMIHLDGIGDISDFTLLVLEESAIPTVSNQSLLPAVDSAPYPLYLIWNHTKYGTPTLAVPYNSEWHYQICVRDPNEYGPVFNNSKFEGSVVASNAVYYNDVNDRFEQADADDDTKRPVGIRGNYNNVVIGGVYTHSSAIFSEGSHYYVGSSGTLLTTKSKYYVGVAISTTELFVNFSDNIMIENYGAIQVGSTDFAVGVDVNKVVYYNNSTAKWELGDGIDSSKGGWGIRKEGNTILFMGIYENIGSSFTPGSDYYAGTSGDLTTTYNNWYIGRALTSTKILIFSGIVASGLINNRRIMATQDDAIAFAVAL